MIEIWKDIEGYEGYQVSNLGRVKSLNYNHSGFERIMNLKKEKNGYFRVGLFKDGKQKLYGVNRLVAKAFLPNPNNLPIVNHKDENKINNMVWVNEDGSIDYDKSNLEWCDNSYNVIYSWGKSVIQFTNKGEMLNIFDSAATAAKITNTNRSSIGSCCKGHKKHNTAGGFKWEYLDEYLAVIIEQIQDEDMAKEKRMAC